MAQNYFSISLPSKCLLYKGIDPNSIQVRAFVGEDSFILAEMTEKNSVEKIIEVLGRCLKGIDVQELTLGDKLYLMVWHAINSYSDGHSAKIICEHCLQEVVVDYKLADLETAYLPDGYQDPYPITLSTGEKANCRLLRVKDELELYRLEKTVQNPKRYQLAYTLVDPNRNIVERVKWLEEMPAKDLAKIQAFQDSFYHGPNFTTNYKCPKCDGEGLFIAPFRLEHFHPDGPALTKNFGTKI